MPIYHKLKALLDSGKLGKVNLITMNFGSLSNIFKQKSLPPYQLGQQALLLY